MALKFLDKYNIQFGILVRGGNEFKYILEKEFFEYFNITDINHFDLNVFLNVEKSSNLLIFNLLIEGTINLPCDRCLDDFDLKLETKNELFIKFSENDFEEQSDNMLIIPKAENGINVAQFIYEFILLGLPIKKVHPLNKKGVSTCNKEMLKRIESNQSESNNVSVWNELNKLKNGTS